jgi:pimeloyl-ACP methyl ester carboxylesterase
VDEKDLTADSTDPRAAVRRRPASGTPTVVDGVHVEVTGGVTALHHGVPAAEPPAVVLLHGFSDNANTWRRIVPPLATRYRVITLDFPGHGRSTRPWSQPLLEGYAHLVAGVLDELGAASASLVGNSMGACVSTVFADRYPHRAEGLALIGMPGVGGVPRTWRAAASRPSVAAMRAGLAAVPVGALQRGFGWIYAHAATPDPGVLDPSALHDYFDVYGDRERLFALGGIARALLADLHRMRLHDVLARLPMPALTIWGRHDRLVPRWHARGCSDAVVVPGCGHCPQLDAPERLLDVLLPFLEVHAAPDERDGALLRAARS